MANCPKCGRENATGTNFCPDCGAFMGDAQHTGTLVLQGMPETRPDTLRRRDPDPTTAVSVLVLEAAQGELLPLPSAPTVVLGRGGTSRPGVAFIDLRPMGADEAGVSRLHARIHHLSVGYFIEDCDSTNGTFLNAQRLVPFMPQGLAGGDELQLGQLKFRVTFRALG